MWPVKSYQITIIFVIIFALIIGSITPIVTTFILIVVIFYDEQLNLLLYRIFGNYKITHTTSTSVKVCNLPCAEISFVSAREHYNTY